MEQETCPCALCGKLTPMLGTQRCDNCWGIERRIPRVLTNAQESAFLANFSEAALTRELSRRLRARLTKD